MTMKTIADANKALADAESDARVIIAKAIADLEALQNSVAEIGLTHVTRLPVIDQAIQHARFGPLGPGPQMLAVPTGGAALPPIATA